MAMTLNHENLYLYNSTVYEINQSWVKAENINFCKIFVGKH